MRENETETERARETSRVQRPGATASYEKANYRNRARAPQPTVIDSISPESSRWSTGERRSHGCLRSSLALGRRCGSFDRQRETNSAKCGVKAPSSGTVGGGAS